MQNISRFSPAEIILLLEGNNAYLRFLLKAIFVDLLLKNVLEVDIVAKELSGRNKVRFYRYIVRGGNYEHYRPMGFELIYLAPFQDKRTQRVLYSRFVKMALDNSKNESYFISIVRASSDVKTYFRQNWIQKILRKFSITQAGLELRQAINLELVALEKIFSANSEVSMDEKKQILRKIKGNVVLLKHFDITSIKGISAEMLTILQKGYDEKYTIDLSDEYDTYDENTHNDSIYYIDFNS